MSRIRERSARGSSRFSNKVRKSYLERITLFGRTGFLYVGMAMLALSVCGLMTEAKADHSDYLFLAIICFSLDHVLLEHHREIKSLKEEIERIKAA